MNFKVGDVVEIVAHPDAYITSWWRVGQFGTITELHIDSVIGIPRHRVLSHTDNKHFRCSERCMRKLPPPPREQTSTWDDVIVWRPKETSHV